MANVTLGTFMCNGHRYAATIGFNGDWRVGRADFGGGFEYKGANKNRKRAIREACAKLRYCHEVYHFAGSDVEPIKWQGEGS